VASPANWKSGEDVVFASSVSDERGPKIEYPRHLQAMHGIELGVRWFRPRNPAHLGTWQALDSYLPPYIKRVLATQDRAAKLSGIAILKIRSASTPFQ
jgi:hypothetical protein